MLLPIAGHSQGKIRMLVMTLKVCILDNEAGTSLRFKNFIVES